jgi:hypothetical protein
MQEEDWTSSWRLLQEVSHSTKLYAKINKNTLIILCNLKYIIKSSVEFIFMFFSFKTVG